MRPSLPRVLSDSLVLTLSLAGCLNAPRTPAAKVTPLQARLVGVSAEGLEFLVKVNVENPGGVEVPASGLAAQVTLDGDKKVGTAGIPRPFGIPGKATQTIEVPVAVSWDDKKVFFDLSTAGRDVPFKMDGLVALGEKGDLQQAFQLQGTIPKEQLRNAMTAYTRSLIHY